MAKISVTLKYLKVEKWLPSNLYLTSQTGLDEGQIYPGG
jgi:hypothetical protein